MARAHLDRAVQVNPNFSNAHLWRAVYLAIIGNYAAGREEAKRAEQLDPLSILVPMLWTPNPIMAGDYRTAIRLARHGTELEPRSGEMYAHLARAYALAGRFREADGAMRHAEELRTSKAESTRALILALEGRREEAAKLLKKIEPNQPATSGQSMMLAWAAAGDIEAAVRWMKRFRVEAPNYARVNIDSPPHPAFLKLRSDPRYIETRRKLGLPPHT